VAPAQRTLPHYGLNANRDHWSQEYVMSQQQQNTESTEAPTTEPALAEYERDPDDNSPDEPDLDQDDEPAEGSLTALKLVRARSASMRWFDNSFFVDPIIRPGTVILLQGAPGSMKTWAALDAMRAIASGTKWLDRFQCTPGMCLGLFLDSPSEDVLAQWRRLTQAQEEEYAKHVIRERGVEDELAEIGYTNDLDAAEDDAVSSHPDDEAYLTPFNDLVRFWWPKTHHLFEAAQYGTPTEQAFAELLTKVVQETTHHISTVVGSDLQDDALTRHGERALLMRAFSGLRNVGVQHVFIDSLSKVHGLNENDNMQMEAVVGWLQRLARKHKVCIWVLHHWAKPSESSGGYEGSIYSGRGASRIPDGADVIFNFIPVKGEPKSRIEQVKVRGKRVDPFMIELVADDRTDEDNDYLLSKQKELTDALRGGRPFVFDPTAYTFSRACLKQAALGTKACMTLVAHIQKKGSINAADGRMWAMEKLGLEEPLTEDGKQKAKNYFKNRLKEASKLGLVLSETKGVYKLTTKGLGKLQALDPSELFALTTEDGSSDD